MTDKQKEALRLVAVALFESRIAVEDGTAIIEALTEQQEPQIHYVPYTPGTQTEPWTLGPQETYGTGTPPQEIFRSQCFAAKLKEG